MEETYPACRIGRTVVETGEARPWMAQGNSGNKYLGTAGAVIKFTYENSPTRQRTNQMGQSRTKEEKWRIAQGERTTP